MVLPSSPGGAFWSVVPVSAPWPFSVDAAARASDKSPKRFHKKISWEDWSAMRHLVIAVLWLLASVAAVPERARAEATVVRAAKQFGLGYIQFAIMEERGLIEKHAKAAGLGDIKVEWATFRSSDVMNDALISGNVDFVSLGIPGLLTIWDRSKGLIDVKGVAGLNALPLVLMVRDDSIKTIADFNEKHRIAVPAVKIALQAILLQMAAEQTFGVGNHAKLDPLTVTMAHPDATIAMITGNKDVTANYTTLPFLARQAKTPGIRRILTANETMGGPFSFNVIAATSKFRTDNPKLFKAFRDALEEATALVNADKKAAAEIYIKVTKDKSTVDELVALLDEPGNQFITKVIAIDKMVDFLIRTGNFKNKPASYKDLLFPEAQ
jgi:NitT/TauT family transport system substrate-binding protein